MNEEILLFKTAICGSQPLGTRVYRRQTQFMTGTGYNPLHTQRLWRQELIYEMQQ